MEGRRLARELALTVFYEAELREDSLRDCCDDVIARVERERGELSAEAKSYLIRLVEVVSDRMDEIDARIKDALQHWRIERLLATDRGVLRMAVGELLGAPDVPVKVVIDEAIEIARLYGSENSPGFVNGVLDTIAKNVRLDSPEEQSERSSQ